ncbi:MAG: trypsin-like peptidase domain-containing protein [Planctomycetota bacterium]
MRSPFPLLLATAVLGLASAGRNAGADAAGAEPAAGAAAIESSVVKIFATLRRPDLNKPWTKQPPDTVTGSGVIVDGKRILTNAHVVLYASQVEVQAHESGAKIAATVEAIGPGIDLAVLKLDDESLFDDHPAVKRSTRLPAIKDTVLAYGYPTGGTALSITKGIVSRIEFAGYGYSTGGLRIQVDAAINPGNSGGPAIAGEEMIGLAFSRLESAQNIGYIIPNEEIDTFLADIDDCRYYGKPRLAVAVEKLENQALRDSLRVPKGTTGVVVTEPDSPGPDAVLRRWDVVTKIGATPIDDQGRIAVEGMPRVSFHYDVQRAAADGTLPLSILRDGAEQEVKVPCPARPPLVLPELIGDYPEYFVFGPLVFTAATAEHAASTEGNARVVAMLAALGNPLATRRADRPAFPGERLVMICSPLFPHRLSRGYDSPVGRIVATVDKQPVKNLGHLVELLRDSTEDFVVFEFAGRAAPPLVFPRREAIAATEEILTDNGVRAQGSPGPLAVWNEKPPAAAP